MAAPPNLSLRQQILQNVADTLATVTTANGYSTTIGTISLGSMSPLESLGLPFVSVLPVSDTPAYGAQVLRRTLLFTCRLWVDVPVGGSAVPGLEGLLADIEHALRTDSLRGGMAHDTREMGVNYVYLVSSERLEGADVHFEIDYTTTIASPLVGT